MISGRHISGGPMVDDQDVMILAVVKTLVFSSSC